MRVSARLQSPNGAVIPNKLPVLAGWQRNNTLEDVLTDIRKAFGKAEYRKLQQPAEGLTY